MAARPTDAKAERGPAKGRRRTEAAPAARAAKSKPVNLRIDAATRALIDRAAAISGQTRTDFMLASARAQAEFVLLDKVYFELGDADWAALNATLEKPAPANSALKAAMTTKPAWERE